MLKNLTGLRFYAAFWVFLFHLYYSSFIPEFNFLPINCGYLGVDVFFVLSGFILTFVYFKQFFLTSANWSKYYNFVVKRFAKIYPLHFITFLMVFLIKGVSKFIFHKNIEFSFNDVIQNVLLIHAWNTTKTLSWNMPSWSISSEWFAYLFVFILLSLLYRFSKKRIYYVISIGIVFIFIYTWAKIPNFKTDIYTYNSFSRIIPEFILGSIMAFIKINNNVNRKQATILFFSSFVFMLGLFLYENSIEVYGILAFAVVILSLSYSSYLDFLFGKKWLVYLGNISFAFYLTGYISLEICRIVFQKISLDSYHLSLFLKFVVSFVLNLVFAVIAYEYFEEPLRRKIVNKFAIGQDDK